MRSPMPGEGDLAAVNPRYNDKSDLDEEEEEDDEDYDIEEGDWETGKSKDRFFSKFSGLGLHRREIDRFMEHYFDVDEKTRDRTIDKLTFVISLCQLVFTTYTVASPFGRRLMPYWYVTSWPILVVFRYFQYKKRKWHYFLLDFCYTAGLLVILYLFAFPTNGFAFGILFAVAHAPLAWTIIAFRNSLVLHSIDKYTSTYIHVMPMVTLYTLRWYPEESAKWWLSEFNVSIESEFRETITASEWWKPFLLMTIGSVILFAAQQLLHIFIVDVFAATKCGGYIFHVQKDDEYMTLFRYAAQKEKGAMFHIINLCGPSWRKPLWFALNLVFTLLTSAPTYVYYRYQEANIAFQVFVFLIASWNGANFYIEVFSRKYKSRRDTIKK